MKKLSLKALGKVVVEAVADASIGAVIGQGVHSLMNPQKAGADLVSMVVGGTIMAAFGLATTDHEIMVEVEETKES